MASVMVGSRAIRAKSFDVICVGRIAEDTFLSGKIFSPTCEKDTCFQSLALGAKLPVAKLIRSYGGNGMNASITMASAAGLKTALVAGLGMGLQNDAVIDYLKSFGVDFTGVRSSECTLSRSTVLVAEGGERTILSFHGLEPSPELILHQFEKILKNTPWIYISSLENQTLLDAIFKAVKKSGAKLAFNPGSRELEHLPTTRLVANNADVVILNRQEAGLVYQIEDKGESLEDFAGLCHKSNPGILVVTDGKNGAAAVSGDQIYRLRVPKHEPNIVDRTGAGDAFASCFVAALIKNYSLQDALHFADRNATGVVHQFGAQAGIVKKLIP